MLRVGDVGPEIGKLHQALVEAGFAIDAAELAGPRFGDSTYHAVRQFQAQHIGPDGHALSEDGVVGSATSWALDHPGTNARGRFTSPGWRCSPSEASQAIRPVIEAAVMDLARPTYEEPDGSNRGPRVDKYGGSGDPWCAYALSYWFAKLPLGSPFGTLASAYKLAQWGQAHGCIVAPDQAMATGDAFVILRAPDAQGERHGHVGLVVGTDDGGATAYTIEGNCSNAVRGMKRARSTFTLLVRALRT